MSLQAAIQVAFYPSKTLTGIPTLTILMWDSCVDIKYKIWFSICILTLVKFTSKFAPKLNFISGPNRAEVWWYFAAMPLINLNPEGIWRWCNNILCDVQIIEALHGFCYSE